MKERPILFSAPMVQAILSGNKTQTRREIKWPVMDKSQCFELDKSYGIELANPSSPIDHLCPYGKVGDQLWVRETFCPIYPQDKNYNNGKPIEYDYRATYKHGDRLGDTIGIKKLWSPSIHMPREASRIQLQITNIHVERLQDISEENAICEGVERWFVGKDKQPKSGWWHDYSYSDEEAAAGYPPLLSAQDSFKTLWKSINGAESWSANPWVWVIEFKRVEKPA